MTMSESAWWLFLFSVSIIVTVAVGLFIIAWIYYQQSKEWQQQAERHRLMTLDEVVRRREAEQQIAGLAEAFAMMVPVTFRTNGEGTESEPVVEIPPAAAVIPKGKLTRDQLENARDVRAFGATWQQLGDALGVSATTVRRGVQALPPKELTSLAGTE